MDFRIYRDQRGGWRWRLDDGGTPFLASGEGYPSEDECLNAIAHLRLKVLHARAVRATGGFPAAFAAA
jgi:uncharacterized protein YegP (UPF0339 family)